MGLVCLQQTLGRNLAYSIQHLEPASFFLFHSRHTLALAMNGWDKRGTALRRVSGSV